MGHGMAQAGALLLGRRTYEDFYRVWPLAEPLPWQNSTLLPGDAVAAVTRLKREPGPDLAVIGSGQLVGALARAALVDEFVLLIHPLVLGTGRYLFPAGRRPCV
jgi:dihydrofolate reductase